MRITLIGPTYPYKGGISHFTTILVRTLRQNHEVEFLSWKRQYPAFLYPVELKDTSSKNPVQENAEYLLDFYNPFSWIKAFLSVKRHTSDLLILTWASPIQAPIYFIISLLTKLFTKTKILYICHNVLPHERAFYDLPLTHLAFSQADIFMVHSKEDKEILTKIINKKKIISGYLPIFDMFTTKKVSLSEMRKKYQLSDNVLLFFGYIRPYKGLMFLLDAMPTILKDYPKTKLFVVGQFWSKDKKLYIDKVRNLKITDQVIFISDYVPNEDIGNFFAISDVVVLPYVSATQSASIQTAYAFNKPVISTTVGGLGDVVEDKVTGYVIRPKDANDIAEKVKLFFHHPIPEKNIEVAKKKFGWEKYIKLLLS